MHDIPAADKRSALASMYLLVITHERYVKGPFDVWVWKTLHISLEGCELIAVAAAYLLKHCFYPNQLHLR
jgi:hypothetical protein